MTAVIITADRLEAKRKERERLRQERETRAGSILSVLDDEEEKPCAPALPAECKDVPR